MRKKLKNKYLHVLVDFVNWNVVGFVLLMVRPELFLIIKDGLVEIFKSVFWTGLRFVFNILLLNDWLLRFKICGILLIWVETSFKIVGLFCVVVLVNDGVRLEVIVVVVVVVVEVLLVVAIYILNNYFNFQVTEYVKKWNSSKKNLKTVFSIRNKGFLTILKKKIIF